MQGNKYELTEVKIGTCGVTGDYRRVWRFRGWQVAIPANVDCWEERVDGH